MNDLLSRPTIAIFPWGDVIEEFLDPIGLTLDDFVQRMTGGWLFGYAMALQHAGWKPIIVAASETIAHPQHFIHAGSQTSIWLVPGRRIAEGNSPSLHSMKRWIATPVRAFREVLKQECCRALLIQEYEYTRFDRLVRLAKRLRIPAYATFQGGDRTLSWLEKKVRNISMKACAGLIIASSSERARVEQVYRHSHPPIACISNPLDCAEWRAVSRATARSLLGLSPDVFIAIEHCRIDIWRKGLDVLIEAWSSVRDGELVIIGSGQDRDAFAQMLSERNLPNVRWIDGYTTDRQVIRNWLSAADVYVMASRVEGMPVAPLEAMACGLPVIATDAQGLPDILVDGEQSGGILVPRDNAKALAAAIDRLRSCVELRERLGRASRLRVESAFSIPAVGAALAGFLR